MAQRFNFRQVQTKMRTVERKFLVEGIKLAQEEMKENFDGEINSETGSSWNSISYRDVPPPILDLTGDLKSEALGNKPVIVGNTATLTIDPIDIRGKGYASYHQDGENQYRSQGEFQREFVTQSKDLENKQVAELIRILDASFL